MHLSDDSLIKRLKHVALFAGKRYFMKCSCENSLGTYFCLFCSCVSTDYLTPSKGTKLY
jgi:hypothetical protein